MPPSLLQSIRRRISLLPGRRNHPTAGAAGNHSTKAAAGAASNNSKNNRVHQSSSSPVSVVGAAFDDDDDSRDDGNNDSPASTTDHDAQQTVYFSTSNDSAFSASLTLSSPLAHQHHQQHHNHPVEVDAGVVSPTRPGAEFVVCSSTSFSSLPVVQEEKPSSCESSLSCSGQNNADKDDLMMMMSNKPSLCQEEYLGAETIPKSRTSTPSTNSGSRVKETAPKKKQQSMSEVGNSQDESSSVSADEPSSSGQEYLSVHPETTLHQREQQQQQPQPVESNLARAQSPLPTSSGGRGDDDDYDDDHGDLIRTQPFSVEYLTVPQETAQQHQQERKQPLMDKMMPVSPSSSPDPSSDLSSPTPGKTRPVRELCLLDHSPSMISELTTTYGHHHHHDAAMATGTSPSSTTTTASYHTAPNYEQTTTIMSSKSTVSRPSQKQQAAAVVPAAPPPPTATTAIVALAAPRKSDANANDIVGKRVEIIAGVNKNKFGIIQQWKNENTLQVRVVNNNSTPTTTVINVRNTSIRVLPDPVSSTLQPLLDDDPVNEESSSTKDQDTSKMDTSDSPKAILKSKEQDVADEAVKQDSQSLQSHSSVPEDVDDNVHLDPTAATNFVLRPTPKMPYTTHSSAQLGATAAETAAPTFNSVLRPTPKVVQEDIQDRPAPGNNVNAADAAANVNTSTVNSVLPPKPKLVQAGGSNQTESSNNIQAAAAVPTTPMVHTVLRPTPKLVQQDEKQQPESNNNSNHSRGKNGLLYKRVKITKGDKKHKGKLGTITNDDDKRSIKVKLDEGGLVVGKALSSLQIIATTTPSQGAESQQMNESTSGEAANATNKPRNSSPRISLRRQNKATSTAAASPVNPFSRLSLNRATPAAKVSVPKASSSTPTNGDTGMAWRVTGYNHGGLKFGNFRVAKLRLQDENAKSEITFLSHLLGDRILVVDVSLNGRKDQRPLEKTITRDGCKYELVSAKEQDDNDQGSFGFSKAKLVRLVYAQVEGNDMSSFSIEEMLLNIGNFSVLNPRKIMARLELFQSPAKFNIVFLPQQHFQSIDDKGYVGCGFVSDEMMIRICTQGGMSKAQAARVVALQVRLFIPTMGIYKGMLMRSPLAGQHGGDDIQLPASMLKVLQSTNSEALKDAAILVCKNGVHPSPGSANEYIGRRLDANRKDPPEKSFKEKIKKPLSDMVFRLWKTLGVPDNVCKAYKKESLKTSGRNHAWLVGVADPTGGSLPPDHIFITGTQSLSNVDKLFVTRSPCVQAEDGRMLKVVTSRPESMSVAHWEWLNSLDFGCIIFANPRPGQKSMPERIAKGDLDGDLYLVCWDEQVLSFIQAEPLVDEPSEDDDAAAHVIIRQLEQDPEWFRNAQNVMIDARLVNDMSRLTGKCYKLAESIADASCNKDLMLRHPDAMALMQAYTDALEFKKHGGKILLPLHLHDKILPRHLQQYLTAAPTTTTP